MCISFIIPVFNAEDHIKNCTDSIFELSNYDSHLNYEVILIDDGSTDNSFHILEAIKRSESSLVSITVYHQENKGVSEARNKGIELARYEYIIFVDADDTIDSKMMHEAIKAHEMNPDIDLIVYGISFDYYWKGKLYRNEVILPTYDNVISREEWLQNMYFLFKDNALSTMCNKIIRKRILMEHNIRLDDDMILYEDFQFSLKIMKYCDEILFIQKPIYHYKQFEHHIINRLRRIEHLDFVIDKVDNSLSYIDEPQKRAILLTLYGYLISDKVKVSCLNDIGIICNDFMNWIDRKNYSVFLGKNNYLTQVYMHKAIWLFVKGKYTTLRHCTANLYKKVRFGVFEKNL